MSVFKPLAGRIFLLVKNKEKLQKEPATMYTLELKHITR